MKSEHAGMLASTRLSHPVAELGHAPLLGQALAHFGIVIARHQLVHTFSMRKADLSIKARANELCLRQVSHAAQGQHLLQAQQLLELEACCRALLCWLVKPAGNLQH